MHPKNLLGILLAAAVTVGFASAGKAADLGVGAPPVAALLPWYISGKIGARGLFERDVDCVNPRVTTCLGEDDSNRLRLMAAVAIGFHVPTVPVRFEIEYANRFDDDFVLKTIGFCPAAQCGIGLNFNGFNFIDYKNQTLMLNGYWDFALNNWLGAFVGAGVGVSFHETSGQQFFTSPQLPGFTPLATWASHHTDTLAWSLTAGLAFKASPNVTVDLAYRFVDLGRYDTGINVNAFFDESFSARVYSHEVLLGFRYRL
jgi:opacity protein-like surface antigen